MIAGTKSPVGGRKSLLQQAKELLWEIVVLLFHYAISWVIVVVGLLVVYWPEIQRGNTKVSMDVVFQGVGITIILYGLNRILKKSFGINNDTEQRKHDEKILSELDAIKQLLENKA